jgi:hypothetical protein
MKHGEAIVRTMHAAQVVATETQYVAETSYCYVMMCHPDARGVIFNLLEGGFWRLQLNILHFRSQ